MHLNLPSSSSSNIVIQLSLASLAKLPTGLELARRTENCSSGSPATVSSMIGILPHITCAVSLPAVGSKVTMIVVL